MKEERANEIVRKVFYANFNMLPPITDEKTAFHIGRMLGKMQKILEIELEKEISKECKIDADKKPTCGDCKEWGTVNCPESYIEPTKDDDICSSFNR